MKEGDLAMVTGRRNRDGELRQELRTTASRNLDIRASGLSRSLYNMLTTPS